jgi:hypothetical protein
VDDLITKEDVKYDEQKTSTGILRVRDSGNSFDKQLESFFLVGKATCSVIYFPYGSNYTLRK